MEITVLSDSHNDHHKIVIEPTDLLIHCGDAGTKGTFTEAISFINWLTQQPARYKIFVPGNHDKVFRKNHRILRYASERGIIVLDNCAMAKIEGYLIQGSGFTPKWREGKLKTDTYVCNEATRYLTDCDILITHCPPYGILDTNTRGEHCGWFSLETKLLSLNFTYHFFGHIHEHRGKSAYIRSGSHFNTAVKNPQYQLDRDPYKFYL